MAPKMIHRIATVSIRPCRVEARTRVKLICQASRPISAVTTKTIGMATRAAMRRPISSTPASTRGTKASSASVVSFMEGSFHRGTVERERAREGVLWWRP